MTDCYLLLLSVCPVCQLPIHESAAMETLWGLAHTTCVQPSSSQKEMPVRSAPEDICPWQMVFPWASAGKRSS